ncbi:addiction module protein [Pseudenhygromyxa sp. WMMC2535]|uniref:addiction module protein n=1 Tax=Pseudenhygromyxa sp. WMMC2535 TaxID=2712867 RepID=UPI0015555746|nr:addiction module protein [Pseudenhygromyxa sp. WMMC2535]NVB41809.1 addiction module protein [Pseudenhygromyxa sp. WMMC2535]
MTEAARKVFDDALALPERDRLELAEALFDSLSAKDQAKIDEAWRTEILRRMEQVRNGEVQLESWEEVRQAGRDTLAQR